MSQAIVRPRYWQRQDQDIVSRTMKMSDLAQVGKKVLLRMPQPIVQVCGPISTGGFDSEEQNLAHFQRAIESLTARGFNVFNQLPFQLAMKRIVESQPREKDYDWIILRGFYEPLFRTGLVRTFYFLPNWLSSTGAKWERKMIACLGLGIEEFPEEWLISAA